MINSQDGNGQAGSSQASSDHSVCDRIPAEMQEGPLSALNDPKWLEIVHNFRNLIHTIKALAECARLDLNIPQSLSDIFDQILVSCAGANDFCGHVLGNSGETAKEQHVDLSDLLVQLAPRLKTCLPGTAVLQLRLADKAPLVVSSLENIRQIVINLVKNASESLGDAPGTVTVATNLIEIMSGSIDKAKYLGAIMPGTYCCLEVSDTGCGMSDATRSQLFSSPLTNKRDGHGLGGLSVRLIVEANGGAIQVESAIGVGTRVRVLLPRAADADSRVLPPLASFLALKEYCDRIDSTEITSSVRRPEGLGAQPHSDVAGSPKGSGTPK